jgi:hypothetical protein
MFRIGNTDNVTFLPYVLSNFLPYCRWNTSHYEKSWIGKIFLLLVFVRTRKCLFVTKNMLTWSVRYKNERLFSNLFSRRGDRFLLVILIPGISSKHRWGLGNSLPGCHQSGKPQKKILIILRYIYIYICFFCISAAPGPALGTVLFQVATHLGIVRIYRDLQTGPIRPGPPH